MQDLDPWLVAARFVHIGACIALFGQVVFWQAIARDGNTAMGLPRRGVATASGWCIGVSLLAGALWLLLVAAAASGRPLTALDAHTVTLMTTATTFGRLWTLRAALALVLALALWQHARAPRAGAVVVRVAAAAYLASLAWAGHAAAGVGSRRAIELASDVVHLLAAGAWLGALPPLAWVLAHEASRLRIHRIARRFSVCGIASVAALLLTGLLNASYRVGSLAALTGSSYGRLLLVKLVFVAAMLALAGMNRSIWTPRLVESQHAIAALRRNAMLEIAAGLAILAVVGAMGVTMPPEHVGMQHTMPAMHMGH